MKYISHIKHNILLFLLKRKIFFFNNSLNRYLNLKFRKFYNFEQFKKTNKVTIISTSQTNYHYCKPVYHTNNRSNEVSEINENNFHKKDVNYMIFNNCIIRGNSNVIFIDDLHAYYEQLEISSPDRFFFTDEGIRVANTKFLFTKIYNNPKYIDEGINFLRCFSWNYYHMLYEVIAKFYWVERFSIPLEIPIILDDIILQVPQFKELLNFFNNKKREVIAIDRGEDIVVGKLYQLPTTLLAPPNYKKISSIRGDDFLFQKESIFFLREKLLELKTSGFFHKKIFLSRKKASKRRSYNESEVFNCLKEFGFVKIFMEDYSIKDQVNIFNNADIIVGATGAAFSNIISCSKFAKILCLTNYDIPFGAFSTIADILDLDMVYLNDKSIKINKNSDLHDSFEVDIRSLKEYMLTNF